MTKADEEMIDAAIGARIRGLRLQNGLTQQFLADELDVSFQQIQPNAAIAACDNLRRFNLGPAWREIEDLVQPVA